METNLRKIALAAALVLGVAFGSYYAFRGVSARADDKEKIAAPAGVDKAASEMAQAALKFWSALTPDQQKKASYPVADPERLNWHFVPKARNGLTLKDMTPEQRTLAMAFLRSGLSDKGFASAEGIINLEPVLRDIERGRGPTRDAALYYFTVFGTPSDKETWGWRVEGHHLSLNILIVDGRQVAAAPSFFGVNPARVPSGPKQGLRVLEQEEDLGRQLVKSLSEEQRKKGIFADVAPRDIVTGNARQVKPLEPGGIAMTELNEQQKGMLSGLVKHYANRLRAELAKNDLEKIEQAGWDKVHFAWAGGAESGNGHYYRVQGPTFLIEYDNTQNNANHIHTVWRDFKGDFGEDILKKHHAEQPH
jgi:hypothetical protein